MTFIALAFTCYLYGYWPSNLIAIQM